MRDPKEVYIECVEQLTAEYMYHKPNDGFDKAYAWASEHAYEVMKERLAAEIDFLAGCRD